MARNHVELKQAFCDFRNQRNGAPELLEPSNICVSSGLDDMIDLIIRCLCLPGQDRILICPPVYHMYQTSATINDIETVAVPLDSHNCFQLRLPEVQKTLRSDPSIKICFVCNPGNPTGFAIPVRDIQTLLDDPIWRGILVVDEAYIDFSSTTQSVIDLVNRYPRLVVLQTLSKAFGLASIRVGFGVACPHLCAVLNNVKKPYSVSSQSIALAKAALTEQSLALLRVNLRSVAEERARLARALGRIRGIAIRGGMETNFVLFEVFRLCSASGEAARRPCNASAAGLVSLLRESAGILVRFKGMEYGCEGCVRVSVGNGEENERFVEQVRLLMQFLERAM
jgi:histidinol-phosphate aminotransferase